MRQAFLIKYGEIALKGKNRHIFEETLVKQIEKSLKGVDAEFKVTRPQGRIFVEPDRDVDETEIIEALSHVFGIVYICPAILLDDEGFEKLAEEVVSYIDRTYPDKNFTFKVKARRARKNYPLDSQEINAALGEKLLDAFPDLKVDVQCGDPRRYQCLCQADPRTRRHARWHKRQRHAALIRRY